MKYVLQIMGDALEGRMPMKPVYVLNCDFDADGGRGRILFTNHRAHARQFESLEAALKFYQTQSKKHPIRADGLPNRPLTAYTVSTLREDEDPL